MHEEWKKFNFDKKMTFVEFCKLKPKKRKNHAPMNIFLGEKIKMLDKYKIDIISSFYCILVPLDF